jgi:hypothetical protein
MSITKFIASAVTALLGTVLFVQAAPAKHADDRAGIRGTGISSQVVYPDLIERYVAAREAQEAALRPDNRGGSRGEFRPTVILGGSPARGVDFQWGDAGIGAAALAGLVLTGVGGLLLVRRHARKSAPFARV